MTTISERPVICQLCREKFVRVVDNFEKTSKWYYHKDCYKQVAKNKSDTEQLFDYLGELWEDEFINYPLLQKQIKEFTSKNHMTVQGILGTLVYITNVKKMKLQPKMGIAIVPYHYAKARTYYEQKALIQDLTVEYSPPVEKQVEIVPQETNKLKRLIDLDLLLD